MEKLLYTLWKADSESGDTFRERLLSDLSPRLQLTPGLRSLRLCVVDSDVEPASRRRMVSGGAAPDALLSLWVDSAGEAASWEPLIDECVEKRHGYQVVESEPLINQASHPSSPGERVHGMCHVVLFRKPAGMSRADWLDVWQGSHTRVAIDTQSTFGYRQNVVVRTLDASTPWVDAIVEENFPPEAMTSDHAFYDTDGDDRLLQSRMQAMMDSCVRFIDFESIDVIPMSEYLLKPLA
jgi:hypothetical protein